MDRRETIKRSATSVDSRNKSQLTRRSVLKAAGAFVAGAGLPGGAVFAAASGSVMPTLSAYMSEAQERALPNKVMQEAKHHILDTVAAMVSGSELPPGRQAIAFARAVGGQKI